MRQIRLLMLFSVFMQLCIKAQDNTISIEDAVNKAYENNIDLKQSYLKILNAEAELDKSGLLPNPVFSYAREDLTHTNADYDEWTASGSLPLNFLWERWSDINSRENLLTAAKHNQNYQKILLAYKIQSVYINYHYSEKLLRDLGNAKTELQRLAEYAKIRSEKGDISEYASNRIIIKLNKVNLMIQERTQRNINLRSQLSILTGSEKLLVTKEIDIDSHTISSIDEIIPKAFISREDLVSNKYLIEGEEARLSNESLKIIPNISFSAGYKKQSDELSGSIIQLDVEIPLFNRNQSNIEKSKAKLNFLKQKSTFLEKKIHQEVLQAYSKYNNLKKLYDSMGSLDHLKLLKVATLSFEQGEVTLVEYIDGINAFLDGIKYKYDIKRRFIISYFELKSVTNNSL